MSVTNKKVFNRRYEVTGNSPVRQLALWFRMKTSVLGNFDTGPGLKNLVILIFIHRFAKPLFWFRSWLHKQHQLRRWVKAVLPTRAAKK